MLVGISVSIPTGSKYIFIFASISVYVHISVCIYSYTFILKDVYMHRSMHVQVHTYTHVLTNTCLYTYRHTLICVSSMQCVHARVDKMVNLCFSFSLYSNVSACIYMYIYTHQQK